jgi:hypothetical protein
MKFTSFRKNISLLGSFPFYYSKHGYTLLIMGFESFGLALLIKHNSHKWLSNIEYFIFSTHKNYLVILMDVSISKNIHLQLSIILDIVKFLD